MLQKTLLVMITPAVPALPEQAAFHECVEYEEPPEGGGVGGGEPPVGEPTDPTYYTPVDGETIKTWNGSYFVDGVAPPSVGDVCAIHGTDPFNVNPYPVLGGVGTGGVICGPQAVVDLYI